MGVAEPPLPAELLGSMHRPRLMWKALKELAHEAHPVVAIDIYPVQGPEVGGGFRVLLEELI